MSIFICLKKASHNQLCGMFFCNKQRLILLKYDGQFPYFAL